MELLAAVEAGDIQTACELFGGQFLEGFYIDAAGGFEEWRESMTRTLNGAGSRALTARLAEADAGGRWWTVERTANQLLELDPYDEQVHAMRIRSIAADGDHARALREIDRAVDLFRRDLGQLPEADLRELIDRIGSGSVATDVGFKDQPALSRFVGRTDEFRELRHAWSSVAEGRGVAIAVCGEAGIGKSRMCMQLLRVAAIEGGRVLDGRCFESASQVPYGGICQALSGIRDADLALLAPHWRVVLAGLLPELSPLGADAVRAVEREAEAGRRQLFEAVVQLIRAMARHRPVALFVDDLQWADASTTDLLHYLTRALSEEPVLILVAVRPEELAPSALPKLIDGFR
ncbi:MAG: AAA family ATPase, partial [Longimicrobiales bacterium]